MKLFTRICVVLSIAVPVLYSCIGSDDGTENIPGKTLTENTLTNEVDSGFVAPIGYFTGEWLGEYSGFDARQDTMCQIRRRVIFSEDNEYESVVLGVFGTKDETEEYALFEREAGVFDYDEGTGVITYYVGYDSVINYMTQRLDSFPGKKIEGKGIFETYQERIYFSVSKDGFRRWIRTDENLFSEEDSLIQLIYSMNKVYK